MKTIHPIELKKRLDSNDNIVILDIREPYEVEICSIKSINIPMGDVIARKDEINQNHDVIVVCKTGKRAEATINVLMTQHGFNNLFLLEGGIMGYASTVDKALAEY